MLAVCDCIVKGLVVLRVLKEIMTKLTNDLGFVMNFARELTRAWARSKH